MAISKLSIGSNKRGFTLQTIVHIFQYFSLFPQKLYFNDEKLKKYQNMLKYWANGKIKKHNDSHAKICQILMQRTVYRLLQHFGTHFSVSRLLQHFGTHYSVYRLLQHFGTHFSIIKLFYLSLVLARMGHTELSSLRTSSQSPIVHNIGVQIRKLRVNIQVPEQYRSSDP